MNLVESLEHHAEQMTPSGLGGAGFALSPSKSPLLRDAAAEITRLQEAKRRALLIADDREKENVALRIAIREACCLLAERAHGSAARSPGHNARLLLEAALMSQPATDITTPTGET